MMGAKCGGASLSRCIELGTVWDKVLRIGLVGPLWRVELVPRPGGGDLGAFWDVVSEWTLSWTR